MNASSERICEDSEISFKCEFCNQTIKGRAMLQMHQYQEHYKNPELVNLKVGNKHPCPVCLKLFTRNRDVKYHISRVHVGDRKFPCNICGKKFKENTHLTVHMRSHTGERPYYCQVCEKGFLANSDLTRHKKTNAHLILAQSYGTPSQTSRVDDADRKFPCNICGKKFKENTHLTKHVRGHTGERPFHCETCDKRFLANSDLRRHQNTNAHLVQAQSNGAVFRYNEVVQNCVKTLSLSSENRPQNVPPSSQNALLQHNILSNFQPRT